MIKKYLKDLVELMGVSSREEEVINYVYPHFQKYCEDVWTDTLGNVIAKIPSGREDAKKIMLFAHMDEIGFIVRKIENDGFIRIERIGGVSTQILPGLVIELQGEKGKVKGVIGTPSHHFIKVEEKFSVPQVNDLYIDIGANSKQEVIDRGINVGCFGGFETRYLELGDKVYAKAIDNRAALAMLLEYIENNHKIKSDWDIYVVAAVMEEFNIRGIMPAVHDIEPDVMIGFDITPSCDTPDMDYNDIALGKGVAITMMNFHGGGTLAGVLPDMELLNKLIQTCQENGIPFQREISPGVITENAFALFENKGIAVGNISVPTRYTHTPIECINLKDLDYVYQLIVAFTNSLTSETNFGKGKGGKR